MKRNLLFAITIAVLVLSPAAFAQSATGTSVLTVPYSAEASFTIGDGGVLTLTQTSSVNLFGAFGGTQHFTYKIRTSTTTGTGRITVQFDSWSGVTGTAPLYTDLTYTSTTGTASGATAVNGTASSSSATNVITFGADAHSADAGDSGTTVWTLVDKPTVTSGSWTTTATYTISAT